MTLSQSHTANIHKSIKKETTEMRTEVKDMSRELKGMSKKIKNVSKRAVTLFFFTCVLWLVKIIMDSGQIVVTQDRAARTQIADVHRHIPQAERLPSRQSAEASAEAIGDILCSQFP